MLFPADDFSHTLTIKKLQFLLHKIHSVISVGFLFIYRKKKLKLFSMLPEKGKINYSEQSNIMPLKAASFCFVLASTHFFKCYLQLNKRF